MSEQLRTAESIVRRVVPPVPWTEGDKVPWDDPGFSERMLREHLSEAHDAASRRSETISRQVDWIQETLLNAGPSRVLDLGCGPGLYANRLARAGHTLHGIDFSPASIQHARAEAHGEQLSASFHLGDMRTAPYGNDYDLAMLLYGEVNVFRRDDALTILKRARHALRIGGRMLVEQTTFDAVRSRGRAAVSWRSAESGLFSARPHLLLEESFWNDALAVATRRWFVIDAASAAVERHAESMQAYTDAAWLALLGEAGFGDVGVCEDWPTAAGHIGVLTSFIATRDD